MGLVEDTGEKKILEKSLRTQEHLRIQTFVQEWFQYVARHISYADIAKETTQLCTVQGHSEALALTTLFSSFREETTDIPGDILGSVSGHCNKVNIKIKQVK